MNNITVNGDPNIGQNVMRMLESAGILNINNPSQSHNDCFNNLGMSSLSGITQVDAHPSVYLVTFTFPDNGLKLPSVKVRKAANNNLEVVLKYMSCPPTMHKLVGMFAASMQQTSTESIHTITMQNDADLDAMTYEVNEVDVTINVPRLCLQPAKRKYTPRKKKTSE